MTSRWVVELFGTVWVRAKSLPSSHIAPSAHRHDRVLGALPLTQVIVDAVNISGQSEPTEPKTSSAFPQVSRTSQGVPTPPARFDSRHLHEIAWDPCFSAYVT